MRFELRFIFLDISSKEDASPIYSVDGYNFFQMENDTRNSGSAPSCKSDWGTP